MPILGMNVAEDLHQDTTAAIRAFLEDSTRNAIFRIYTKATKLILRRMPYTGDYGIWGWSSEEGFFEIAKFGLLPMPGCRDICIFHHSWVEPRFRRVGLGSTLLALRMQIARRVGYSAAICTVRRDNIAEQALLRKYEWHSRTSFANHRTQHEVEVWTLTL